MQSGPSKKALSQLAPPRASRNPDPLCALLVAAATVFASIAGVSSASAADSGGAKARQGEAIFKQKCVACHNKQPGDTSPFGPPNLSGVFRGPTAITTKQATEIIINGKTVMPPFGSVLTKTDIDDLIAYLKTK
jgi:mono/diheme cytochrome c family protein